MDLKEQIKKQGKTLTEVAKILGKTLPNYSQQINYNPTITLLEDTARACGCTLSELLREDGEDVHSLVCPHCGQRIHIDVCLSSK